MEGTPSTGELAPAPLLTASAYGPVCYANEAAARAAADSAALWLVAFGLERPELPPESAADECSETVGDEDDDDGDTYGDDPDGAGAPVVSPGPTVRTQLYCARTPQEQVALQVTRARLTLAGYHCLLFSGRYLPRLATVLDGDVPVVTEERPGTFVDRQVLLDAAVRLVTQAPLGSGAEG